jgi:hypothetical protein
LKTYFTEKNVITNWIVPGIILALAFTNHMTALLSLPFIGMLFFTRERFNKFAIKKIMLTFLVSLPVVVTTYLYLPIRALSNPVINWGNPINLENFIRHISGRQYQVWLFSSMDAAKKQLIHFLGNLPSEFTWPGLIFALWGFISLYRKSKKFFWILSVSFLLALSYSINYDIVDIDSYFIFNYFIISIFIAVGCYDILTRIISKLSLHGNVLLLFLILGIIPILFNFGKVDQSDNYIFEDYTKAIFESTEKESIIFSYQWDYFISASYYFQHVENFRKDAVIIDKELLRRSWYFNQLERNHPDVLDNMKIDIQKFLNVLKPFEEDEKFDPNLLEINYRNIMTKLISENSDRNYYIGIELIQNEMQRGEFSLPIGYKVIPHLLLFKVVQSDNYVEAPDPNFKLRLTSNKNKYTNFIEETVGKMLSYRILYELEFNKFERAKIYYKKIRTELPGFQIPITIEERMKQIL